MMSKLVIIALFASLAVAHGATRGLEHNSNLISAEKEGRLIEIPIIGSILLKTLKVGWYLLSAAFSLVGYKIAAVALLANLVLWGFKNFFSVVLGAATMLGFCKLTGKCNLNYVAEDFVEVGDTLFYAARSLEGGETKYGDDGH